MTGYAIMMKLEGDCGLLRKHLSFNVIGVYHGSNKVCN
jgi:hypothetical protein